MRHYERTSEVEASAEQLFDWHAREGAFERLNPPWNPVTVLRRQGAGLDVGLTLTLKVPPSPVPWVTRHTACDRPAGFVDELVKGPLRSWRHEHGFADRRLTDRITFQPLLGLGGGLIERQLDSVFRFRHRRTALDLGRHAPFTDRPRLKVAITGGTGSLGGELAGFLRTGGHEVRTISRSSGIRWDPSRGEIDAGGLEGLDALVHLAGESLAERWTPERKERILRSRVDGTALLVRTLRGLRQPPKVFLSGSAVGYYGDRGDEALSEEAEPGTGFLADVGRAWEAEAPPLSDLGIRVVRLRTGLVLSARAGLLQVLARLTRLGGGGRVGSGRQWQPWIAIDDWVGAVHALLWDPRAEGPVNLVSPGVVRQEALATTLAGVLRRPSWVPAPAFAVGMVLGSEMAQELALASQRVVPAALGDLGFAFAHPDLEQALRFELGALAE